MVVMSVDFMPRKGVSLAASDSSLLGIISVNEVSCIGRANGREHGLNVWAACGSQQEQFKRRGQMGNES
jgi:hypothetical protein